MFGTLCKITALHFAGYKMEPGRLKPLCSETEDVCLALNLKQKAQNPTGPMKKCKHVFVQISGGMAMRHRLFSEMARI